MISSMEPTMAHSSTQLPERKGHKEPSRAVETSRRKSVRAGSVWESRMQSHDVKTDNFKAFDIEATDNSSGDGGDEENETKSKKESALPDNGDASVTGKRRTWKSGGTDEKNPVQSNKNTADPCEDQCQGTTLKLTRLRSSVAVQTKKSPVKTDKVRSEAVTPVRRFKSSINGVKEKNSPVSVKKARSESMDGNERTPGRVRKTRSELCNENIKSDEFGSGPLRKVKSCSADNSEDRSKEPESREASDRPEDDRDEFEEEKQSSPDEVNERGDCPEKNVATGEMKKSNAEEQIDIGDEDKADTEKEKEEEEEVEEVDEAIVVEKTNIEVNVIKQTNSRVVNQFLNRTSRRSSTVGKVPPPVIKRASVNSVPPNPISSEEEDQSFPQSQSKLQSLVDLVMWRDVSRSAFVFGLGTFIIISSSYANDLNFSCISVAAYAGLVYLAAIFVFRSVIHRGEEMQREMRGVMVREEEVIWMLRLILPYLNELLFKLRAVFSGDPSTTLKMGAVLFVLARCGSSITIWKTAKLGFFVVFTVPKIFSSYSTYLSAYGEFWVRRMRDAWESCTHKRAVALALFTLVWNLSSVVARVWSAFMLFVALRYYRQKIMVNDGWPEEEEEEEEEDEDEEETLTRSVRKQTPSKNILLPNKLKKLR